MRISLRLLIPLALLAFTAGAGLWSLHVNGRQAVATVERQETASARRLLTRLQESLENFILEHGLGDSVEWCRQEIAAAGADPAIVKLFLIDNHDWVIAANRFTAIGQHASEALPPASDEEAVTRITGILQARKQLRPELLLDRNGDNLYGIFPVRLGTDVDGLRPTRTGILFAHLSLKRQKALALTAVQRQVIQFIFFLVLLAIGLGILLQLQLTGRIQAIVKATGRMAAGDLLTATGVHGNDEIGRMAAALEEMAGHRHQAEERIRHLNLVLIAIRRVNRAIVFEKDIQRLVQTICDTLIDNRGYFTAWIVLLDEAGQPATWAEAGIGQDFEGIIAAFRRNDPPLCARQSGPPAEIKVIGSPVSQCTGCCLQHRHHNAVGAMSCQLRHGDEVYGFLTVSLPHALTHEPDEESLFAEIAGDVAFAVYSGRVEAKRRAAEEEVQSLNRQIEFILGATRTGINITDADFNLRYIDPEWQKAYGPPAGRKCYDYFMDRNEPCEGCGIVQALREKRVTVTEEYLVKEGNRPVQVTTIPFQDRNGEWLVAEVNVDISERKKAEEELRASEKRFRLAFENATDAILWADPQRGVIINCNRAAERLFARPRSELIGLDQHAIHPEAIRQGEAAKFHSCIDNTDFCEIESEIVTKDGRKIPVTIHPSLTTIGEQQIIQGVFRDISAQMNMERQLRQAQKMEAIGTLAGGIAHDFNNILACIFGYTEITLSGAPANSAIRPNLEQVLNAAQRAKELVKQILTFCRQAEQERKPLAVPHILKEALKLLRAILPTTIEIKQQIDVQCPPVLADPTQIHQVVMNVCTNAYHAMRESGGTLTVALSSIDADAELIRQRGLAPGPYLKLTIADTGCGMDRHTRERIFEPYFTTKAKGEGTGLGLAVVHGIVESHNGAIFVSSEPGEGATFTILLPAIADQPSSQLSGDSETVGDGSERVLLVDDEKEVARMLSRVLSSLGFRVTPFTNSTAALEAFRRQPHDFDLVITDQTMPQLTGDALAREILATRPGIPVIIVTGYSDTLTEEQARAMGIRAYLMKPTSRRDLVRAIRGVLNGKGT